MGKELSIQKYVLILTSCLFTACGVKNFPKETPFVYNNKIEITGSKFNKHDKKILLKKLAAQLSDSMHVNIKERFLFFKQIIHPPAFDTSHVLMSIENIEIFLKTIGYYNAAVDYKYVIDTANKQYANKVQYRVKTTFAVNPGKPFKIDSIAFLFTDSINDENTRNLQQLADENRKQSLLKKNIVFKESIINEELDRLVMLYRNNGYFNFSRELLYADVDTVFLPLLNPMLNPFERLEALQKALKRNENPTINVFIRLSPQAKSTQLIRYNIGKVVVYPDYGGLLIDSINSAPILYENIYIKQKSKKFRPSFITAHNYLSPGAIYKSNDVNRTFDELNNLGTWQFVKIDSKIQYKKDSIGVDTPKINFDVFMMPVRKYAFSADLESVFNQTQQAAIGTAGNLIGFGLNLGLRNRNFDHQGIVVSNTIRGGIESGIGQINQGIQATEITYGNSVTIPKLLGLGNNLNKRFTFKRTVLNANISSIDRNVHNNGLFKLTNIGASVGWQIRNKRDEVITFRPAYVEFVNLYNISSAFKKQLDTTPFLRYSFSQGLVLGNFMFSFAKPQIISRKNINNTSSFRFSIEESGLIFGRLKNIIPSLQEDLFEYIRAEIEIKYEIRNPKNSWAFRIASGAGYLLNDSINMPFFKQFTGGGPNSMRAWPLRSIGPGASPLDRRAGRNQFFSRSGDMIFEANAEFRYDIANIVPNTFAIRGAIFSDIGNVWNLPNKTNEGNDTVVFRIKNFYRDLSVSVGTGIRFDFIGLFLIRFDFGLRIKNPALPFSEKNDGWRDPKISLSNLFGNREEDRQWRFENFNFSLGINYPF
jgi:outer membrane protein insertion porin family